jgi:hypothetical protein
MFVIIQTGGTNTGKVRSVHRSFNAASKAQPATFHGLVNVGSRKVGKGEMRHELIDLLRVQTERRRQGLSVTGTSADYATTGR